MRLGLILGVLSRRSVYDDCPSVVETLIPTHTYVWASLGNVVTHGSMCSSLEIIDWKERKDGALALSQLGLGSNPAL